MKKRKVLVKTGHRLSDVWVMVSGVMLTYELRDVLLNKLGWLNDDHIDATQHIIQMQRYGTSSRSKASSQHKVSCHQHLLCLL